MQFASDNTAPAHPKILEAITAVNTGYAPAYAADAVTEVLTERLRDLFEAPDALIYPMTSGTATNAALLGAMSPPWGVIYCHKTAHIEVDERGAATFYSGGAKLKALASNDSRLDVDVLRAEVAADAAARDVHASPPAAVSITNLTEFGEAYSPAQIGAIAQASNLPVHLDGARFANAMVRTGASGWEMTRELASLSLGGTKNGCFGSEVAVLFDPALKDAFESHRMRGGQNISKARYISAQMLAWLENGLWLELAAQANAMATRLAKGLDALGASLPYRTEGNMVFAQLPLKHHARAWEKGAVYHPWGDIRGLEPDAPVLARFVSSWSTTEAEVDQLLDVLSDRL